MVEHKINCSFCGKSNTEVQRVLTVDKKVAICDECILICLQTLIYDEPDVETIIEEEVIVLEDEVIEGDLTAQKNCGC